jgi:hypothetical protein
MATIYNHWAGAEVAANYRGWTVVPISAYLTSGCAGAAIDANIKQVRGCLRTAWVRPVQKCCNLERLDQSSWIQTNAFTYI